MNVIVEVDENQHSSYACECEQGRMIQIHQDFGGTPILFIRFNPDTYAPFQGAKEKINQRYKKLLETLRGIKNYVKMNEWETPLVVTYLYYDGFNGVPEFIGLEYMEGKIHANAIVLN